MFIFNWPLHLLSDIDTAKKCHISFFNTPQIVELVHYFPWQATMS